MDPYSARAWMWSEACETLARAERLHRQMFRLTQTRSRLPAWEPPADVLETDEDVRIFVAVPGVDADRVDAVIEDGHLILAGERVLPPELRTAVIHRLELPQGRFERRLRLPGGRYRNVERCAVDGCLLITLTKAD